MTTRMSAAEALANLKSGNRRFVAGESVSTAGGPPRGESAVSAQRPIAIILGCSDSRVPAELVFDQGFGDLFVIRVAGNVVAPTQIASVEFAASLFGTRLVVVLGHSQCGAIEATLDEMHGKAPPPRGPIRSIVDRVKPALTGLVEDGPNDHSSLMTKAVRANIRASVDQLSKGSDQIRQLLEESGLEIIGAEYSLETGVVEFLDQAK